MSEEVLNSNYPFYKDKNLEPEIAGVSRLHDIHGNLIVKNTQITVPELPEISADRVRFSANKEGNLEKNDIQVSLTPAEERKLKPIRSFNVEENQEFPVNIGNHYENTWSNTEIVDNNDDVDVDNLQGMSPFNSEPVNLVSKEDSPSIESKENKISSIPSGHFCILIDDTVVFTSEIEGEISQGLEMLMSKYDINMDRISVIKKMNVIFGFSIK